MLSKEQLFYISDTLYRLKAESYVEKMTGDEKRFLYYLRKATPNKINSYQYRTLKELQERIAPNEGYGQEQ